MFLGIEIGGTKLQLGLGRGDGEIRGLWRGTVDPAAGGEGIRRQIEAAIPELLASAGVDRAAVRGVGVGFGGPTDDATQTVIKSHQIAGWDGFPLAEWVSDVTGLPAVLSNDADVAGLAEALFGAGKWYSPVFYITVGSGIGGGLIIDGEIYRGVGRGAAEIGHIHVWDQGTVEDRASGWGIRRWAAAQLSGGASADQAQTLLRLVGGDPSAVTPQALAAAARQGDTFSRQLLSGVTDHLGKAIATVIALLCPRRVVIGGGVSLIGEDLFFGPIREAAQRWGFQPFAGLTEIVPAALGEEVVVHGALALARKRFGGEPG